MPMYYANVRKMGNGVKKLIGGLYPAAHGAPAKEKRAKAVVGPFEVTDPNIAHLESEYVGPLVDGNTAGVLQTDFKGPVERQIERTDGDMKERGVVHNGQVFAVTEANIRRANNYLNQLMLNPATDLTNKKFPKKYKGIYKFVDNADFSAFWAATSTAIQAILDEGEDLLDQLDAAENTAAGVQPIIDANNARVHPQDADFAGIEEGDL